MKFTFSSEFVGFGSPETTMSFEADQIEDVIANFEQFLMGAGFTWLQPNSIQFVESEPECATKCGTGIGGCGGCGR